MSVIPYLLRDAWNDVDGFGLRQGSLFDQNFGLGVIDDDLLNPNWITSLPDRYVAPFANLLSGHVSDVKNSKDCFKVNIDVQQFKPNEITVKATDNCLVVEGKHEERQDEHGYITRHFQRRYRLPDDVESESIISNLSSDGVLSVEAPKKVNKLAEKVHNIPITFTNTPAAIAQNLKKSKM